MSFVPRGIIPAMVTCLTPQYEPDPARQRQVVRHLLEAGVHGIFATGTQGEFYALHDEEKRQIWEVTVEEVQGRIPVYAGTGSVTTRDAIRLTQMAEKVGVDAVSVLTPYFTGLSQLELYAYFADVAGSTSLPVILYTNPARTGNSMGAELVSRLSHIENIAGIKDSSGDLALTAEYLRLSDENFHVLMGRDTLIFSALMIGATGTITATGNVVPKLLVEIYDRYQEQDYEGALAAQQRLAPLRNAFSLGIFSSVVKTAMGMIGLPVGPPLPPAGPLTESAQRELAQVIEDLGFPVNKVG